MPEGGDVRGRKRPWRALVAAVIVGIGLGYFSIVGEGTARALTIVANLASPWGMGAFLVGMLASSPRRGALAGGVALISGMVTLYLLTPALYLHGVRDIAWTIVAMIVGPLMGLSGALIATGSGRSHTAAVIAPSAMLLAEATWFASERRIWLSNFRLEPYRLNDVAVLGVLVMLGLLLPLLLSPQRGRLPVTYLVIFLLSGAGAGGFAALQWVLLQL